MAMTMGILDSCLFGGDGCGTPLCDDDIDLAPDQLRRECGEMLVSTLRPSILDFDSPSLDVSVVSKP